MKSKFANLSLIALLSASAVAALANEAAVEKTVALKDGATLYIFQDGKMAMEDQYGRSFRMKKDEVMETKDGKRITMTGDEVARLDDINRPTP